MPPATTNLLDLVIQAFFTSASRSFSGLSGAS